MELNASQFQGGGFVNASQGANGTPDKKANYNGTSKQTLRAVTVQQLMKGIAHTTDDQWEVDGAELHNITLVGELVSVTNFSMNVDLVLHDGTGTVKIQHWLNADADGTTEQQPTTWQVGNWVRMYGTLRRMEDEVSITSYHIRPIASWIEGLTSVPSAPWLSNTYSAEAMFDRWLSNNHSADLQQALIYHNLQVIFQHLHLRKGGGRGSGGAGAGMMQSGPNASGFGGGAAAATPPTGGGGFMAMGGDGGLSAVQSAINDYLNGAEAIHQAEGVALSDITAKFGSRFDSVAIQKACTWLVNEGHAFEVTDNYYKSISAS